MPDTEPCRNRDLFMTAVYICVTYGYSLRGYYGFLVDFQRLIDRVCIRKYDMREPHVIVSVIGIFKGGEGYRIHMIPLINVTHSEIRIRVWLERLVSLLKAYRRNNYP